MKNNKTLIVTGATNQIGYFLLPRLAQAGYTVHAVSRQAQTDAVANWIQADLCALPENFTLPPATGLIHLAGIEKLPAILRHPASQNIRRLIAFSSTSRFSKSDSSDPAERTLAQQLSASEDEMEQLGRANTIEWTLFRPTLVYGCGLDRNISFIAGFIRRFGFFPVLSPGTGLRSPVHADDLARACLQAWDKSGTYRKAYNLSGGNMLTYREMVRTVFAMEGKKPRLLPLPASVFLPLLRVLGILPGLRGISPSMVQRMNQDLVYAQTAAKTDFAYEARSFGQ